MYRPILKGGYFRYSPASLNEIDTANNSFNLIGQDYLISNFDVLRVHDVSVYAVVADIRLVKLGPTHSHGENNLIVCSGKSLEGFDHPLIVSSMKKLTIETFRQLMSIGFQRDCSQKVENFCKKFC